MARLADSSSSRQYFLGPVSRHSPHNWDLCKEIKAWGVTQSRHRLARTVNKGDVLIVWLGGRGYAAAVEFTAPAVTPRSRGDVPWEGGTVRWAAVLPFKVVLRPDAPVWRPFVGDRQEQTGLSKSAFRSSLTRLKPNQGEQLLGLLREEKRAKS